MENVLVKHWHEDKIWMLHELLNGVRLYTIYLYFSSCDKSNSKVASLLLVLPRLHHLLTHSANI